MARSKVRLVSALAATLLLATTASTAAQTAGNLVGPRQAALSYREFPEAGPEATDGRDLTGLRNPSNGRFLVGIDINSRVTVTFDQEGLAESLIPFLPDVVGDERTQSLLTRLRELTKAVAGTEQLVRAYSLEVELYAKALSRSTLADEQRFLRAKRERATIADQILTALGDSIEARLGQTPDVLGLAEADRADEAVTLADAKIDPIYDNVLAGLPYNMVVLGEVLNGEIELVEVDVSERLIELGVDPSRLTIELQGHLVRQDGSANAVPLEKHNTVEVCAENRVDKIDFGLSAEEQTLLEQYELLAQQIQSAQAEGKSLLESVKTAFEQQQLPIFEAIETVETAVKNVGDQLDTLFSWTQGRKLQDWLQGPAKTALEESQPARQAWTGFKSLLEATGSDFRALESLAELGSIRQLGSSQAIVKIMNVLSQLNLKTSVESALDPTVWSFRLSEARGLLDPTGADVLAPLKAIDGPLKDWSNTTTALEELQSGLSSIQDGARQALAQLRGGTLAPVAAELPEPEGQQRRELTADLDTEFDLNEVCGRRDEGDEVRLAYTFLLDDEELAGTSWTDTFVLRFFGWHGTAKASIALVNFTDASNSGTWEPTTPVSYLLGRRAWPDAGSSGLKGRNRGSMFTFGFSTMPLDFSDEESVELGLTASVGLLDNFVVLGYGVNLQANEEKFFLVSLRPFSLGSLFSPAGPSP